MSTEQSNESLLYDRQIRLWGHTAQSRIRKGSVFVINANTCIAHEVIKNIALTGVGTIYLLFNHEPDMEALFYQKNECRDSYILEHSIKMLNPDIRVEVLDYSPDYSLERFSIVFYCLSIIDSNSYGSVKDAMLWNEACRRDNVLFYYSGIVYNGEIFGFTFCDYLSDYSFTIETDNSNVLIKSIPFVSLESSIDFLKSEKDKSAQKWIQLHLETNQTNSIISLPRSIIPPFVSIISGQSSNDIIHGLTRKGMVLSNLFIYDSSINGKVYMCWNNIESLNIQTKNLDSDDE